MSDQPNDRARSETVDRLRDEFGAALVQAARANSQRRGGSAPLTRRFGVAAVVLAIAAVPAGLAGADLFSGGDPQPAPEPVFGAGSQYPDCPAEVQRSILELERLSDYKESPGYPAAGCPTLEALEQNAPFLAEFERREETIGSLEQASPDQ